jgi:hypothetical protein
LFNSLTGNWKIKKNIHPKNSITGNLLIKKNKKNEFLFIENTELNSSINGYQNFLIKENNKIYFYFNSGANKGERYQMFNKNIKNQSFFNCKKDIYCMKINKISNNFFTIITKIKGPKKNIRIYAKYFRTI